MWFLEILIYVTGLENTADVTGLDNMLLENMKMLLENMIDVS